MGDDMRRIWPSAGIVSGTYLVVFVSMASAQAVNDPAVGGQLNREWGAAISQIAKMRDDSVTGGGMGAHARSTQAADNVGGFANSNNAFGITFNEKEEGGNAGRQGVGNVSKNSPHNVHPGDGGNGQHALNNLALTNRLDPVTGEAVGQ